MTPTELKVVTSHFSKILFVGHPLPKNYELDGPFAPADTRLLATLRHHPNPGVREVWSEPAVMVAATEAASYGLLLGARGGNSSVLYAINELRPTGHMLHIDQHTAAFPRRTLAEAFGYASREVLAKAAETAWLGVVEMIRDLAFSGQTLVVSAHWMMIRLMVRSFARAVGQENFSEALLHMTKHGGELYLWTSGRWLGDVGL